MCLRNTWLHSSADFESMRELMLQFQFVGGVCLLAPRDAVTYALQNEIKRPLHLLHERLTMALEHHDGATFKRLLYDLLYDDTEYVTPDGRESSLFKEFWNPRIIYYRIDQKLKQLANAEA